MTVRARVDMIVERVVETAMPTAFGAFTAVGYRSRLDDGEHLALVHGEIGEGEDVPVHVHQECPAGDALEGLLCTCGTRLRSALATVAAEGRGVVVYLRGTGMCARFRQPPLLHEGSATNHDAGAAILRDLGVRSMRSSVDSRGAGAAAG